MSSVHKEQKAEARRGHVIRNALLATLKDSLYFIIVRLSQENNQALRRLRRWSMEIPGHER